jgi:hypothetical protein
MAFFAPTITIGPAGGPPGYTYHFSQKEFASRPGDTLTITLDDQLGNGTQVEFRSFCSSPPGKITALVPPQPSYPYPPGIKTIKFQLNLDTQQMVSLGIVVRVTDPSGGQTDILCECQVGDTPP